MNNKIIISILLIIIVLILGFGFWWYFTSLSLPPNSVKNTQNQTQTQNNETFNWPTYKSDNYSFEFKYPETLNTKYASFNIVPGLYPSASVIAQNNDTNGNIINGCFVPAMDKEIAKTQPGIMINNMLFCLTTESSPGAGQLYNTYYYTTLHNGNYYTLDYVVHTLNGCSPYEGTADYQPCLDFFNNYGGIVMKPIEDSVATLTFTK